MRVIQRIARTAALTLLCSLPSQSCDGSIYRIWIPRDPSADALYRFMRDGKAGYIDQAGKIVVSPRFETLNGPSGAEFHDGLLEIGVSSGVYADKTGRIVISKNFYRGWDFSEGLAVAMRQDFGKWGYIDVRGEFVISPRFDSTKGSYVWPFKGGYAQIEVNNRYGYINHSGFFVIPPRFLGAEGFSDGMARVVTEGPCTYVGEGVCPSVTLLPEEMKIKSSPSRPPCKFSFVDEAGRVLKQQFEGAAQFSEDLAAVRVGKLWGYISKAGDMVIEPRFLVAGVFSSGLAAVSENGKFGYIDRSGAFVISPQFGYAEDFHENRAVVGDEAEPSYWYIDRTGRQVIVGRFALASPFFKGLAHVKLLTGDREEDRSRLDGTFAYIDRTGRRAFTYVP